MPVTYMRRHVTVLERRKMSDIIFMNEIGKRREAARRYTLNRKEQLRHRAVSLRQHGLLL